MNNAFHPEENLFSNGRKELTSEMKGTSGLNVRSSIKKSPLRPSPQGRFFKGGVTLLGNHDDYAVPVVGGEGLFGVALTAYLEA